MLQNRREKSDLKGFAWHKGTTGEQECHVPGCMFHMVVHKKCRSPSSFVVNPKGGLKSKLLQICGHPS